MAAFHFIRHILYLKCKHHSPLPSVKAPGNEQTGFSLLVQCVADSEERQEFVTLSFTDQLNFSAMCFRFIGKDSQTAWFQQFYTVFKVFLSDFKPLYFYSVSEYILRLAMVDHQHEVDWSFIPFRFPFEHRLSRLSFHALIATDDTHWS